MFGLGQKVLSHLAWSKFWPILANQETLAILHENEAKKKKNLKKKFQNGRLKKSLFSKIANSQNFFAKISWIGPWDCRIDWYEGHWCGSTYMAVRLFDISSKKVGITCPPPSINTPFRNKRDNLWVWLFYSHFWGIFCQPYRYLSQTFGADGHFEVLNMSKS